MPTFALKDKPTRPLLVHDQVEYLGIALWLSLRHAKASVLNIECQSSRTCDRRRPRQGPVQIEFHAGRQSARLDAPEVITPTPSSGLHFERVSSTDCRVGQRRRGDGDFRILMAISSIQTPAATALHAKEQDQQKCRD
jgi:hypothetical protein